VEELPPFPTMGVKITVFLKFIEDNGGKDAFLKKNIVKEPFYTYTHILHDCTFLT
jgi:hypothetical protein